MYRQAGIDEHKHDGYERVYSDGAESETSMIDMLKQAHWKAAEGLPLVDQFRQAWWDGNPLAKGFESHVPGGAVNKYVRQGWIFYHREQNWNQDVWIGYTNDGAGYHTEVTITQWRDSRGDSPEIYLHIRRQQPDEDDGARST